MAGGGEQIFRGLGWGLKLDMSVSRSDEGVK